MSGLTAYISEAAAGKKKTPQKWLADTVSLLSKCDMATHVGKFTHPDVKVYLQRKNKVGQNAYVLTENVDCETDIVYSSAAYMGAAKLLLYALDDGRPLWKHIHENDGSVRKEVESFGVSFDTMRQEVERMMATADPAATDGRLRQIYFPAGERTYHLLTVLPSSSLLQVLNGRSRHMRQHRFDCRNEKSELYGNACDEIMERTVIGFGGTKAQNISAFNARVAGKADLLMSMPALLEGEKIRRPHRNFLEETVPYRAYFFLFRNLHELFLMERNNAEIRNKREALVCDLIDVILQSCYRLREESAGWSNGEEFLNLPQIQKIWLDEQYREERTDEWAKETGKYFAKWFIYKYRRIKKEQRVSLGEEEMKYIRHAMIEVLMEEVRSLS